MVVSDTISCFCLGFEMVPKGIKTDGVDVGVGWRGVDELEMRSYYEVLL